jgi:RNA polymerase sigma factor (TIGR02999 family)
VVNDSDSLTEQLQHFSGQDRDVAEAVLRKVMPELHRIALRHVREERYIAPLSATELISEVWLQSLHKGGFKVHNREHFYNIAGIAMRRVLVNFARRRLAQKRGQGETATAIMDQLSSTSNLENIVHMGRLMEQLELEHPEWARIADLHFFSGFTFQEIAEKLGMTERQVRVRWEHARDWLKKRLSS